MSIYAKLSIHISININTTLEKGVWLLPISFGYNITKQMMVRFYQLTL